MTKWEVCLKHLTPPAEVDLCYKERHLRDLVVSYLFPGTAFLLERLINYSF